MRCLHKLVSVRLVTSDLCCCSSPFWGEAGLLLHNAQNALPTGSHPRSAFKGCFSFCQFLRPAGGCTLPWSCLPGACTLGIGPDMCARAQACARAGSGGGAAGTAGHVVVGSVVGSRSQQPCRCLAGICRHSMLRQQCLSVFVLQLQQLCCRQRMAESQCSAANACCPVLPSSACLNRPQICVSVYNALIIRGGRGATPHLSAFVLSTAHLIRVIGVGAAFACARGLWFPS